MGRAFSKGLLGGVNAAIQVTDQNIKEQIAKRREARLQDRRDAEYARARTDHLSDVKAARANQLSDTKAAHAFTQSQWEKSNNARIEAAKTANQNAMDAADKKHFWDLEVANAKASKKESPAVKSLRTQGENTQKALDKAIGEGAGEDVVKALTKKYNRIQNKILSITHPVAYAKAVAEKRASDLRKLAEGLSGLSGNELENAIRNAVVASNLNKAEENELRARTQTHTGPAQDVTNKGLLSHANPNVAAPTAPSVGTPDISNAPTGNYNPTGAEAAGQVVGQAVGNAAATTGNAIVNDAKAVADTYQKYIGQPFVRFANGVARGASGR